ncbi:DUF805 domain-containing protein [Nocardioides sp.]|uniref:DUF805 domain-containing protein n=1 Tax=Nocardioides sp. TaxID=35761 RepID=UPI003527E61D
MSFGEAVSSVLNQYVGFEGRARRREYWFWVLALVLAEIVAGIVYGMSHTLGGILLAIIGIGTIVPTIAVSIRRLHDTDRSGWWLLLGLVPFGALVLWVFYLMDGTPGDNQYGPSPKAVAAA